MYFVYQLIIMTLGGWWVNVVLWIIITPIDATTMKRGPFGWDPSVIDFRTPTYRHPLYNDQITILNCSFSSPSTYGVLGWMRCPMGPDETTCRYMWLTYDNNSVVNIVGMYDDGHSAATSISTMQSDTQFVVNMGLELLPIHANLGGHACIIIPIVDDAVASDRATFNTFVLTADILTEYILKGPILKATFSVLNSMIPKVSGATILRIKEGPEVHFEGRLDVIQEGIDTTTLSFMRVTMYNYTVFSLSANISNCDIGFSLEIDDGRGGLVGRSGIQLKKRNNWKTMELTIVFATLLASLATITLTVPHAERPFGLWCALCIGWMLRSAVE